MIIITIPFGIAYKVTHRTRASYMLRYIFDLFIYVFHSTYSFSYSFHFFFSFFLPYFFRRRRLSSIFFLLLFLLRSAVDSVDTYKHATAIYIEAHTLTYASTHRIDAH